jgi:acyl-CoA synthetase (AMP-forming)/AMP-acid ligase II/acyl carrier protein
MTSSLSDAAVTSSTLVGILRARAGETPEALAYTFLRDGEVPESPLTYAALDEKARSIAAWLQDEGAAGERALLLYPPGVEFVAAFFGCLYAGVVAVPAYPPRPNRPDARIQQIVTDAAARFVLTTTPILSSMEGRRDTMPGVDGLQWLATDTLPASLAGGWKEPALDRHGLAFLQYTSGSTLAPKGVMVSHGNILDNSERLDRTLVHGERSVAVTWLPHFHDMGLIYGILQPLYRGFPCYLMPPAAFLQRPLRWPQAISRFKGTHAGGPNFAYELCASRMTPDQREGLDLSTWEVAFNGAEPVRHSTLQRFNEAFGPVGFRWSSFCPAYGMAEATLMISISRNGAPPIAYRARAGELERNDAAAADEGDASAWTLVGCGRGEGVSRVAIVDPQTLAPCPPARVGEIWVSGASIAQGYWRRPDETERTFNGRLAGSGEGPFLRTGDLGFTVDGEVFITGRLKDLIIVRGLNHYPHDIEQTVETSHSALRPSAGAAFSVDADGEERLVLVQEVERTQRNSDLDDVVRSIRRAVTDEHEIDTHAIVLVRPGSILKTSSGKIQRRACRTAFLEGSLSVLHAWQRPPDAPSEAPVAPAAGAPPRNEEAITSWLVARLSREAGIDADEIDLGQPFASFGVDSARALLLVGDLEIWLGRKVPPIALWNYPTVEALARHLAG